MNAVATLSRKPIWRRLSDNSEVFDVAFVGQTVRFRRSEMSPMVSLGLAYFMRTHVKGTP
jgi:hypothetical protein